jgi:hypothetical protein
MSQYDLGYDEGVKSQQRELERVRAERNQLAALINELALIPAPDFYRTGDYAADLVNKVWQRKNAILAAGVEA